MEDDWGKELGRRIKDAREKAGLSQEAVAKLIDRTKGSISNWERAERTPDFSEIRQLADATNADLRWLMFGDSYRDPLERIEWKVDSLARALEGASARALGGDPIQGLEDLVRQLQAEQPRASRPGRGGSAGSSK